jgi:hypothetical protein
MRHDAGPFVDDIPNTVFKTWMSRCSIPKEYIHLPFWLVVEASILAGNSYTGEVGASTV